MRSAFTRYGRGARGTGLEAQGGEVSGLRRRASFITHHSAFIV